MRPAPAVAAAKAGDRVTCKEPGDPAFIGLRCCWCACNSTQPESWLHEKIIDMPVGRSYPFPFHSDVTGNPGKTPGTLCGTGIHMPSRGKRHLPQRSDLYRAASVHEYQAVDTFIHIRSSGAAAQLRCGVSPRGGQECRDLGRDPLPVRMQVSRSTVQARPCHLPENRTSRNHRR